MIDSSTYSQDMKRFWNKKDSNPTKDIEQKYPSVKNPT